MSEAIAAAGEAPRTALRWRILAGILAAFHVGYVVFVLFGALLVLVWPLAIWVHLASVVWAAGTMLGNLGCPVTTWEKEALRHSGQDPYAEGFLQHHVLRRTFSPGNERRNHILLGLAAIALNAALYAVVLR